MIASFVLAGGAVAAAFAVGYRYGPSARWRQLAESRGRDLERCYTRHIELETTLRVVQVLRRSPRGPGMCKTLTDCARRCHELEQATARLRELEGIEEAP